MKKKQKFCGILSAMLLVTFSMAVHAGNVMPRNIDDYKLFTSGGEQYRAKFNVEPYYTSTSLINLEGLGRKHNLKVKMEVYKRDISADYIYYEATYEKSDYAVSVLSLIHIFAG